MLFYRPAVRLLVARKLNGSLECCAQPSVLIFQAMLLQQLRSLRKVAYILFRDHKKIVDGAALRTPELPKTTQATARPPNSPPASMYRMNAGRVLGVRGLVWFSTRNCSVQGFACGDDVQCASGVQLRSIHAMHCVTKSSVSDPSPDSDS